MTDAQWRVIDRLLPDPVWIGQQGGRPETHCRRQIMDAIFYLVDNGTKWRALPVDFPPWSTVYNFFAAWAADGVTTDLLDTLRQRVRLSRGARRHPDRGGHRLSVGQSRRAGVAVKPRLGRRQKNKRPQTAYRRGHPGSVDLRTGHPANVQDRDGARPLLTRLAAACGRIRLV